MNQTILIVEDETAIARLLQLELEQVGFHTVLAFDGLTGLEKAKGAEHCLQCGACMAHCPQKIQIPQIMEKLQKKE